MKAGGPRSACIFLPRFAGLPDDRLTAVRAAAAALFELHTALAGRLARAALINGLGPLPLPSAISSMERPEATDRSFLRMVFFLPSRDASSRCLIRSQLVRFSPSRERMRVRIQPPDNLSPLSVKSSFPLR